MTILITFPQARARLAKWLDEVTENQKIVIIKRRGRPNVVLIAEDELSSLLETAHLLRSPENVRRLSAALNRAVNENTPP
jgi:antitoxin YefM